MAPDGPPIPRRTVVARVTVGEPETSLWCGTCLLPSAVRVPLLILGENGVYEAGRMTLCTECDPPGGEGTGLRLPSEA